jgi:hypothetical protein
MSHTKGPWIWSKDYLMQGDGDNYSTIGPSRVLLQLSADSKLSEDNARLITAAPELLEACKEFLECGPNAGSNLELVKLMKQVIAKAEGES